MRFPALAIALFTSVSLLYGSPSDPAQTLVDSLIRTLTSGDTKALLTFAEANPDMDRFWTDVTGYECITVRGYRFTRENAGTLRLELDASAVTLGASHKQVTLPSLWIMDVACDAQRCRLLRVETEESRAARLFADAPPADENGFDICPGLDPLVFAHELAEHVPGAASHNSPETSRMLLVHVLETARRAGDRALEAWAWVKAAPVAGVRGDHGLALELARAGLAAAEASGDPDTMATARFRMGIELWGAANANGQDALTADACRWLDAGGELVDRVNDPRIAIKSLYMAGYIKRLRGDVRSCLLDNERVIELSRRYRWPEGASVGSLVIGEIHLATRDYPLAADDFRAAYRYGSQSQHADSLTAEALAGLGIAQMNSGNTAAAAAALRDADRLRAATNGSAAVELEIVIGSFLMRSGHLAEAEARLLPAREQAQRLAPWRLHAEVSNVLSQLRLAQKRPAEALAFARESLDAQVGRAVNVLDWSPWHALLAEAKALRVLGRGDDAAEALRMSVDAVEDQRGLAAGDALTSARFFEDKVEPYLEMIDLLIDRGRTAEAFDYAERMKGRALQDVLAEGNVDRRPVLPAKDTKEEERLTKRLADLNKAALAHPEDKGLRAQVAAARMALERFDVRMEIAHPWSRTAVAPRRRSRRFPSQLRDGLVIEFVTGERRTIVFAVSRDSAGNQRILARPIAVSRGELERRVAHLERQIGNRDPGWTSSASSLYAILLSPIEHSLRNHKLISVVPDGVLWRVPFPLLRHDGRDLVERAAVFYAPSLSMLQLEPRRATASSRRGEILAFGNPTVGGQTRERVRALTRDAEFGELPSAEAEVQAIASLFDTAQSRVYVREAARESVFKREGSRFRILHFATHGILDDRSPMYSAIVLAASPNEADDGLLEAREIVGLHIESDLAVLASCDTARGRFGAGEGVIGMSWAFLVAGCPTTVVSQWQIHSRATEEMMIAFYRRLRAGDAPAEAMRQAQLSLRANRRYKDPFYWASFIVVGEGMRTVR
jgi:CHAT domain-containing protein